MSTPLGPDVDVGQLDALAGEQELADLVGVGHPAGLEHGQDPVVLAVALHRLDQEPRVDERGDLLVGLADSRVGVQAGEQRGHALGLQEVDLPGQHRRHVRPGADAQEIRDRVHDDDRGIELADELLHGEEVRLEAEQARAEAPELQQAGVHPLPQVDAHRGHVADDLRLGLLEGEVHRPLAAAAGGVAELRRQRRLAGAGGAADEDGAALVEAAVAEHRVEAGHAGRHPLGRTRCAAGRAT